MPSAPVPWVHPCWQGHAPSLQPHPPLNAQRLALRAWSWSGAKMLAACTPVPCLLMTWSTHYRWRTRTTGGVDKHTRTMLSRHGSPHDLDWLTPPHHNSSQFKLGVLNLGKNKNPEFCSHCTPHHMLLCHSQQLRHPLHYFIVCARLILTLNIKRLHSGRWRIFFMLLAQQCVQFN